MQCYDALVEHSIEIEYIDTRNLMLFALLGKYSEKRDRDALWLIRCDDTLTFLYGMAITIMMYANADCGRNLTRDVHVKWIITMHLDERLAHT